MLKLILDETNIQVFEMIFIMMEIVRHVEDTTEKMINLCGNKQTCDQLVTSDIFTDKFFGIVKLLRVWYQCVGDGILVVSFKRI